MQPEQDYKIVRVLGSFDKILPPDANFNKNEGGW
jgi:hypothetical protein